MTTDIIFGHGRALQFERYITCKSIDITALFTNTPRHHTALVYHKMWRAEAREPEADRVMERGAGETRRGEVYLQTLSIATGLANRSQANILHG